MPRNLSLALGVLLLGGVAYLAWPEPAAPPTEPSDEVARPADRVPFLIKAKTRQLFEEWEKLAASTSVGDRQASRTKINLAVQAIRERLHADGLFSAAALQDAVRTAAAELGYHGQHTSDVLAATLEGEQSQQKKGSAIIGALKQVAGAANQAAEASGADR
jgi:hypothetical protein